MPIDPRLPGQEFRDFPADDYQSKIFTDELNSRIKGIIISIVDNSNGVPADRVLMGAVSQLGDVENLVLGKAVPYVENIIQELVNIGDICKVEFQVRNKKHTDYYPKGTSFTITPCSDVIIPNSESPYLSPLHAKDYKLFEAAKQHVEFLSGINQSIVVRLMQSFCARCGVPSEGHWCRK